MACTAQSLCGQIGTITQLVKSVSEEQTKNAILDSHAESLKSQIRSCSITADDSSTVLSALDKSAFSQESQDALKRALAERLVELVSPSKIVKRSTQSLKDIGPFLRQCDVEYFSSPEYAVTAKVDRMAFIFARLGCSNPNEQTSGKAMAFLKEEFQVAALNDPQTFYQKLQEFKASVKSHSKNVPAPSTHLTTYSTPQALPQDLHERAYKEAPPAGLSSSASGSVGPLRGSHGSIKSTKKPLEVVTGPAPVNFDASLLNGVFTSFSQMMAAYNSQGLMQPNPQISFARAKPQLALEDAPAATTPSAAPPPATPTHTSTTPVSDEKSSSQEPLNPKEQAEAMLAAWEKRAEERKSLAEKPEESKGDEDRASPIYYKPLKLVDGVFEIEGMRVYRVELEFYQP